MRNRHTKEKHRKPEGYNKRNKKEKTNEKKEIKNQKIKLDEIK